ncbi:hypothetical protein [Planobispora takensis]|uniref:Secreted protein n=1 Tax=Planobispora takensis TaxID=1367882 RepID=A0A8J3T432_9ACTN|nr:hypothetical protein [Planobispora takensis]GII05323.1 hypothetical protein Pta02_73310 [Planobispora takensis]
MKTARCTSLVALATAPLLLWPSSPAQAAPSDKCTRSGHVKICISVVNDRVQGYAQIGRGHFKWATIFVQQCSSPKKCRVIAANSVLSGPRKVRTVGTTVKPAPRGHIFRAGGSWIPDSGRRVVRKFSPFKANPCPC